MKLKLYVGNLEANIGRGLATCPYAVIAYSLESAEDFATKSARETFPSPKYNSQTCNLIEVPQDLIDAVK